MFDWIEVRVERLQYDIDLYQAKSENRVGYVAKNSELDKAFKTTNKLIADSKFKLVLISNTWLSFSFK